MQSKNTPLKARNGMEMTEILNILNLVRKKIKENYPKNLQQAKNNNKIWESTNGVYNYSCLFLNNNNNLSIYDLSISELIKFNAPEINNINAYWDSNFNKNSQRSTLTEELIKKIFCKPLTLNEIVQEDIELINQKWVLRKTITSAHEGFNIKYILTPFTKQIIGEKTPLIFSGRIY